MKESYLIYSTFPICEYLLFCCILPQVYVLMFISLYNTLKHKEKSNILKNQRVCLLVDMVVVRFLNNIMSEKTLK